MHSSQGCGLGALHTSMGGVASNALIKVVKQHVGPEREGLAPARNTLARNTLGSCKKHSRPPTRNPLVGICLKLCSLT